MKVNPAKVLPGEDDIRKAFDRISNHINLTPVLTSQTLNEITGASIFFKCENFQKAGAFKFRGASNALSLLSFEQAEKGVCTHSSGNHAQALTLAARSRSIPAFIVMPENAPSVKVDAVKQYGGNITFCKPTLEARESTLQQIQEQTGATFIHPYNNIQVIEGQASCFYEMLGQLNHPPDAVVVPVGGGGLLSGTGLAAKYFSPTTKVIGAEPLMANDAWKSFREKRFVPSKDPQTIADGLRTSLGDITFPIILNQVHDILTASEEGIIKAMFLIWERMKIVVEPSAAVVLAVLMEHPSVFAGKNIAAIFSGGNVDLKDLPWF